MNAPLKNLEKYLGTERVFKKKLKNIFPKFNLFFKKFLMFLMISLLFI